MPNFAHTAKGLKYIIKFNALNAKLLAVRALCHQDKKLDSSYSFLPKEIPTFVCSLLEDILDFLVSPDRLNPPVVPVRFTIPTMEASIKLPGLLENGRSSFEAFEKLVSIIFQLVQELVLSHNRDSKDIIIVSDEIHDFLEQYCDYSEALPPNPLGMGNGTDIDTAPKCGFELFTSILVQQPSILVQLRPGAERQQRPGAERRFKLPVNFKSADSDEQLMYIYKNEDIHSILSIGTEKDYSPLIIYNFHDVTQVNPLQRKKNVENQKQFFTKRLPKSKLVILSTLFLPLVVRLTPTQERQLKEIIDAATKKFYSKITPAVYEPNSKNTYVGHNKAEKDQINTKLAESLKSHSGSKGLVIVLDHTDFKTTRALIEHGKLDPTRIIVAQLNDETGNDMSKDRTFGHCVKINEIGLVGVINGLIKRNEQVLGIYADFCGTWSADALELLKILKKVNFCNGAIVAITITTQRDPHHAHFINEACVHLIANMFTLLPTNGVCNWKTIEIEPQQEVFVYGMYMRMATCMMQMTAV